MCVQSSTEYLCSSLRSSIAASAGERVNALNSEIAMANAMVSENCLYRIPVVPGKERYRHEYGNQHQRRRDDGAGHFGHGDRSRGMRVGPVFVDMPLHIFDYHDRVIDDQSRRQRNAEEGERIDGEAEDLDECKSADQRHRNGYGRNDCSAPIQQEEEDYDDDDKDRFFQRRHHFPHRVAHHRRRVESDDVLDAGRKRLRQFRQFSPRGLVDLQRVGIR